MFLKKIYIEEFSRWIELSKGINVLPNEDSFEFDCIAFGLGLISSKISREFDFDINNRTGNYASVKVVCDFDNKEVEWTRNYCFGHIDYNKEKDIAINEAPIIVYYNGRIIDVYHDDYNDDSTINIGLEYLYKNNSDNVGFYAVQGEMSKLFKERIKMIASENTNNDRFKYVNFHCENIKRIVNEAIGILNFHGFNFNIAKRCFTLKKNNITYESVRNSAIPYLIGICLDLYYRCMIKNPNAFEDVLLANGIALINVNFGERPSYSDNKWKYYHFFERTFPNVQLIAL